MKSASCNFSWPTKCAVWPTKFQSVWPFGQLSKIIIFNSVDPSSSSINRSESDEVAFLMPSQAPLSINSVYQPKAAEQRLVSPKCHALI